ncbi:MAG: hypothetical protein KAQ64_00875 [Candidatus Pacebacteria bacterium]|nr:hypothetical protein [Candidatus Paceibacterota bacterium]
MEGIEGDVVITEDVVTIGDVVTNELIEEIVNNSENPLTISELAAIIKEKTRTVFIRRKIIEYLRQVEKLEFFYLEEGKIVVGQCQHDKATCLNLQRLS